MALIMINPASSWFEIAELPVVEWLRWQTVNSKELLKADEIFDKTWERIVKLVKKPGYIDIHGVVIWYTTMEVILNCTLNTCVNHTVSCISQPRLRIHKQTAYWNVHIKSLDKCYAQLN